ncbi:MAG: hypothetical protein E7505_01805 [Ruminococcus sp.]|nr:hypothetical protein [Ruminococcus sp.]
MENVMLNGFTELSLNEMDEVNGGGLGDAALKFAGGVSTTCGVIALINGAGTAVSIASIPITAALLSTPAGWAMIGCCVVGGLATAAVTVDALKN